jgi:hypothetical protein
MAGTLRMANQKYILNMTKKPMTLPEVYQKIVDVYPKIFPWHCYYRGMGERPDFSNFAEAEPIK